MDGVARYSAGFRDEPWTRLTRTGQSMSTRHLRHAHRGPCEAVARVRGIHRRLGGTEATTGRTYRVDDPDLLLWVHCCEVDSLLTRRPPGGAAADRRRTPTGTSPSR